MIVDDSIAGYVIVRRKRQGEAICAAVIFADNRLTDITFYRPEDQKCNRTRQAAMRALKKAGYR